jgi:hypothetical protein
VVSVPLPGFVEMNPHPRRCGVCGEHRPTVRVTSIVGETREAPGVIDHINICQDCLADQLEKLTGYRLRALLARWDKMKVRPDAVLAAEDMGA